MEHKVPMPMPIPFSTTLHCLQPADTFSPLRFSAYHYPLPRPQLLISYSRDPASIALAYTPDSVWRNRSTFLRGHSAIESFLNSKWEREANYRLRKELFAFGDDKIAVQFWYERCHSLFIDMA